MFNRYRWVIAGLVLLTGCAHPKAVRVDCDGPLRPINHSAADQPTSKPADAAPARHKKSAAEARHER